MSTTAPANAGNTAAATRAECTLALDDYQSEINTANKFDQLAFDYEGEIMPAYKAGQAGSGAQVQAITEKLAMWNVQVSALADEARALNPKAQAGGGDVRDAAEGRGLTGESGRGRNPVRQAARQSKGIRRWRGKWPLARPPCPWI